MFTRVIERPAATRMLSGARLVEMFAGDGGFALTVVNAAGLRQHHSHLLARRAPRPSEGRARPAIEDPGAVLDAYAVRGPLGHGLAATMVWLGARSVGLGVVLREIAEGRWRWGASVWTTGFPIGGR